MLSDRKVNTGISSLVLVIFLILYSLYWQFYFEMVICLLADCSTLIFKVVVTTSSRSATLLTVISPSIFIWSSVVSSAITLYPNLSCNVSVISFSVASVKEISLEVHEETWAGLANFLLTSSFSPAYST